ncbi:MAG: DegT/DnrJ/EryC1/StrS family aminotransferase [Pyrinomonadaceae bacterium]
MSTSNQEAVETGITALAEYLRASNNNLEAQQAHCCASNDAVAELEGKLRRYYNKRHALCVSNATNALYVLGLALDLKGCEFATTPFTYGATIAGMLLLNNVPHFADIQDESFCLDPLVVASSITPKTKVIISVDIFGIPADSRALRKVADDHGLWLISDSSQSFGAKRDGLPAGVHADALVVSFTAGKTLFAGEGGAILTDNSELYEKLLFWSQHPLRQRREIGLHLDNEFAFNGRISPLSAVYANALFESALEQLQFHQRNCEDIIRNLNISGLTKKIRFARNAIEPAYFRLAATWKRHPKPAELLAFLLEKGVSATLEPLPIRLLNEQSLVSYYAPGKGISSPRAYKKLQSSFCLSLRT